MVDRLYSILEGKKCGHSKFVFQNSDPLQPDFEPPEAFGKVAAKSGNAISRLGKHGKSRSRSRSDKTKKRSYP